MGDLGGVADCDGSLLDDYLEIRSLYLTLGNFYVVVCWVFHFLWWCFYYFVIYVLSEKRASRFFRYVFISPEIRYHQ